MLKKKGPALRFFLGPPFFLGAQFSMCPFFPLLFFCGKPFFPSRAVYSLFYGKFFDFAAFTSVASPYFHLNKICPSSAHFLFFLSLPFFFRRAVFWAPLFLPFFRYSLHTHIYTKQPLLPPSQMSFQTRIQTKNC